MFKLNVIPAKVKEMADWLEEGWVEIFDESAREGIQEGREIYQVYYEDLIQKMVGWDWSSTDHDMLNLFIRHNKMIKKKVTGFDIVIDGLRLAISRSEKRSDKDYISKKNKYTRLIGMIELGKSYYMRILVDIPEWRLKQHEDNIK